VLTTTRGFFLTDMSCSHEVVQTSLTRLFDTAAAAWSRRFRGFPRYFPFGFPGTFGLVLVPNRSVLSSRRPGQDKNPGNNRGSQAEGQSGGKALV